MASTSSVNLPFFGATACAFEATASPSAAAAQDERKRRNSYSLDTTAHDSNALNFFGGVVECETGNPELANRRLSDASSTLQQQRRLSVLSAGSEDAQEEGVAQLTFHDVHPMIQSRLAGRRKSDVEERQTLQKQNKKSNTALPFFDSSAVQDASRQAPKEHRKSVDNLDFFN